ncbi:hypothetical protein [Paenibacillus xanthanilyticus]|uniref:DUF4176 domain-containing protein n=1 Tax=Paenibacillus xanthanilyticus TaxID=1783531 RepID=A0ABV8KC53_9BACL
MVTPISIRINGMLAQKPFYRGLLLPNSRHAIYIHEGSAFLLPVVPFTYEGLYAQDGNSVHIAYLSAEKEAAREATTLDLYTRLTQLTAFELLTGYYDDDAEAYLLINEPYPDELVVEYDDFGAPLE